MALHIYRTLLLMLPGWFREEFSREMTAVFRDTLTDARRDGFAATASLWNRTVGDLLALSLRLHAGVARQDVTYAWRTLRRTPTFLWRPSRRWRWVLDRRSSS